MPGQISVEIIGFQNSECSPFPCNEERTCGLSDCYPTNKLTAAFGALESALRARLGDRVSLSLTLLDKGVPDRIKTIIEKHHPALPVVLVNGRVTPVGRIALDRIIKEIEKEI